MNTIATYAGSVKDRLGRLGTSGVLLALVGALVLAPSTAFAGHGSFSYSQQTIDYSSSFQARAKSSCSGGCYEVRSDILKSGNWTRVTCQDDNNGCYTVYGVWKSFSFPTWVYTYHWYEDTYSGALPCNHCHGYNKSVWYP